MLFNIYYVTNQNNTARSVSQLVLTLVATYRGRRLLKYFKCECNWTLFHLNRFDKTKKDLCEKFK